VKLPDAKLERITVVIPCHNEAATIAQVISKLPRDELAQRRILLHVLVIDNNSSDGTAAAAELAGAEVVPEPNKGKGNALRTGFRVVPEDTDYVVMLDGDDTYSSEELMRLIEPLRSNFCDVVVGSRLHGHMQPAAMSKRNLLGNWLFTLGVRLFYRANITDVLTGYFAWKKPALDALRPYVDSPGFAIEMEMITKMARLGLRMAAVPISYHPRSSQSNLRPFRDGLRILAMLLKNFIWKPDRVRANDLLAESQSEMDVL
jgi:glycosyltransferase involved in cell wall biosynthesis